MANPYTGEKNIKLHGITYPMKVDLDVIVAFNEATGRDFMEVAIGALNAFAQADHDQRMGLDRAHFLTKAVPMKEAAHLFYLAAKKCNSQVEFDEMQEAVLMEGPLQQEGISSYPVQFVELCTFAIIGPADEKTKKS